MTEILPPYVLQASAASNAAKLFRRAVAFLVFEEGVGNFNGANDLKVSQRGAGANMSVDVARGGALVKGDDTADQGFYFVYNDATVNKVITAADPTNPRKDIVIAEVNDNQEGQAGDNWTLTVLTGTPAPSPVEPALPATALKLAVVDVPATDTSIEDAQITDSRTNADPAVSAYEDGVFKSTEPKINLTGNIDVADNPSSKRVDVTTPVTVDKSWNYFKQVGTSPFERWYPAGPVLRFTSFTQSWGQTTFIEAMPFHAPRGGTLDRIGIEIITAGVGSVRLGIYRNTSDTVHYPSALVVDAGEVNVASTGVLSRVISVTLDPLQSYWLVEAGTFSTGPQQRFFSKVGFYQGVNDSTIATFSSSNVALIKVAGYTYEPLPDPFYSNITAFEDLEGPLICVRFSA